jgi:hypothetical protein
MGAGALWNPRAPHVSQIGSWCLGDDGHANANVARHCSRHYSSGDVGPHSPRARPRGKAVLACRAEKRRGAGRVLVAVAPLGEPCRCDISPRHQLSAGGCGYGTPHARSDRPQRALELKGSFGEREARSFEHGRRPA